MGSLLLQNTATGSKEEFQPITPGLVRMYVCGPTVYDLLHVGNFRGAIFFNLVRNFLEAEGYRVEFAYNFTDVDDKILAKAQTLNLPPLAVSEKYIQEFLIDYQRLGLRPHTYNPKVSEFIPQMIAYVQQILDRGLAYTVQGSVYLRRHQLDPVGKLSGRHIDDGVVGEKNEIGGKEHASDFALWKGVGADEWGWDSPWGRGRPGWHLECSVMIQELFQGQTLDIHGGGLDLLFPHHENECAQCEAYGKPVLANFWLHNNMLNLGGAKMAKSVGNVLTGRAFMDTHSPELLKFMILSHHYRSVIDFSTEQIENHRRQLAMIYQGLRRAKLRGGQGKGFPDLQEQVRTALRDDFQTPVVLALVFEALSRFNQNPRLAGDFLGFMKSVTSLFQLFGEGPTVYSRYLDEQDLTRLGITVTEIESVIVRRQQARQQKDFVVADELRAKLVARGINLLDTTQGTSWEVIR